jgi:predicted metal-dependent hydrolase
MALSENRHERMLQLLENGRRSFDTGRYLEAVAHWELAWREEYGATRQLLQGLMQAAGAYRKMQLGHPQGMHKLIVLAQGKLRPIPDGFAGLRLDLFLSGLERSRLQAAAWLAGGERPDTAAALRRAS